MYRDVYRNYVLVEDGLTEETMKGRNQMCCQRRPLSSRGNCFVCPCTYTACMEARGYHGMSSPSTPYLIFEIDSCTTPGQHRQQPLGALLPLLPCWTAGMRCCVARVLGHPDSVLMRAWQVVYPLSRFPSTEEGDSKHSHIWCMFP